MNTFIDLEKIDILCGNYRTNSINMNGNSYKTCQEEYKEVKSQQTVWKKITSKVKAGWEIIKPVVSGLTTFFTVAAAFLRSVTKFGTQCKNLKAVFA